MLRSPISPANFCTLARSSSRNPTSSGDSGAAFEIFFPGILTPNHQSNAKTAATAIAMRRALKRSDCNTAGTRLRAYAIFLRNRNAQKLNSKIDITIRTTRFGQYSSSVAPRKMIARMSAMKYVVGKSAPSA
jgi:uncharacterized membrane protein